MLRVTRLAGVCTILLLAACDAPDEMDPALALDASGIVNQTAIIDGSTVVKPFFRFAPPVVSTPLPGGKNDADVYPTLEICELTADSCGLVLFQFTRPGKGQSKDKLEVSDVWSTKWRANSLSLDANKNYRVRVRLDSYELGHVDVDLVDNAKLLATVNKKKHVGILKGSEVKFAFWIESEVFTYVKHSGAMIVADHGNFTLDVPKDAVRDAHVGVLIGGTAPEGATLVAGTYYEVVPTDLAFSKPAELSIKYKSTDIPQGVAESSLKLLQYVNGSWAEVSGAVIDTRKHTASGPINGAGQYAVGVIETEAPVVNVVVQTSAPSLGSVIAAVQRISTGAARTSCVTNLRDESGSLANQYWRGPSNVTIVNGECPFEGYVTRAGTYHFEAIVDGVVGQSAPFTVGAPQGTQLQFSGIPAGPYYTSSVLATDNIVISVVDGAGHALSNTDVEVQLSHAGFSFGGAATNSYAHTTDAAGQVQLPPGTWTLREVPGVNSMRAELPNTSASATHEITTNSGAPAKLFANPVIATAPFGIPLSVNVFVQDANGVAVNINDLAITATLSNGSSTAELGSVNTANGEAQFTFSFTQHGPNYAITFAANGLAAHTTNTFTIMGAPPAVPGELRLIDVTNNSISVDVQNVVFNGDNPMFQIRYMESPGGGFATIDVPASSGAFVRAIVSGLNAGTQFDINARACDSYGCSDWSSNLSVPTLQPGPQNLRTTSIGTTFTMIAWDAQAFTNGASHTFEVWLRQGSGALQLMSNTTAPNASFTGLAPNTQYTAEVRACNASGCTPSQVTFSTLPLPTPPAAPTRLQINSQLSTSINLGWTDNSNNESGFYVLKQTLPQTSFVRIATVGAGVNTYSDTNVIQGQTVVYQVQSFNEGGTTGSNVISTVVPAGQTQSIAPFNTVLTQQGTAGQASMWPLRVRVINMSNNAPLFGVPVTFTITGGTGTFTGGAISVVMNTNASGLATAPNWILGAGTNTATATAPGMATIVWSAQGN